MRATYNKNFFEAGYIELNPRGQIGENEKKAFTCGQCHALALAIVEATGWPFVAVNYAKWGAAHCGVRLPDGRILDVEGPHTESDWLKSWGSNLTEIADLSEVREKWPTSKGGDMHPLTKHAPKFVDAVLAMVEEC